MNYSVGSGYYLFLFQGSMMENQAVILATGIPNQEQLKQNPDSQHETQRTYENQALWLGSSEGGCILGPPRSNFIFEIMRPFFLQEKSGFIIGVHKKYKAS
jgi:hypothetical protein